MHFVLSNNIQTILAVGLGTCQGELKKKKKRSLQKILSAFLRMTSPVMEEPRHSVASETTLESTNNKQSCHNKKNRKYTPEQQLASQSSMSVNCAD